MSENIWSVGELTRQIKDLLDGESSLQRVYVRGELSNYKVYPSGHHYFTIKDEEATLKAVMFRREASRLRFRPESGMKVIALGRITVYPRDGVYQLYATELVPDGVGDLHAAFEQLKAKLSEEGLFDRSHKKPLPPYPERIAVITSSAGAAVGSSPAVLCPPARPAGRSRNAAHISRIRTLRRMAFSLSSDHVNNVWGILHPLWIINIIVFQKEVFLQYLNSILCGKISKNNKFRHFPQIKPGLRCGQGAEQGIFSYKVTGFTAKVPVCGGLSADAPPRYNSSRMKYCICEEDSSHDEPQRQSYGDLSPSEP